MGEHFPYNIDKFENDLDAAIATAYRYKLNQDDVVASLQGALDAVEGDDQWGEWDE